MTEDGSSATSDPRRRGPGFPSMPLQDAIEAVVTAGLNGRDHSHDAFATYLGHKTSNSGAFRAKLASLRDFGLIVKRGDPDRVALSELAERLTLAEPDFRSEKGLILAAFESCRVFEMLHADSAKNVGMDISRLRTMVIMRLGVAKDQADKFVDSFTKSAVFAGLAELDGSKVTLLPREPDVPNEPDGGGIGALLDQQDGPEEVAASSSPRGQGGHSSADAARETIPVAIRQEWPIDGGAIEFVIRTPKAMPLSIYGLLAKMAEVAAEMESCLTTEGASASPPRHDSADPRFAVGD